MSSVRIRRHSAQKVESDRMWSKPCWAMQLLIWAKPAEVFPCLPKLLQIRPLFERVCAKTVPTSADPDQICARSVRVEPPPNRRRNCTRCGFAVYATTPQKFGEQPNMFRGRVCHSKGGVWVRAQRITENPPKSRMAPTRMDLWPIIRLPHRQAEGKHMVPPGQHGERGTT